MTTPSRDRAQVIADTIAAGSAEVEGGEPTVHTTTDVRNVVPPCVLVEPPTRRFAGVPSPGYEATWRVRCLAPAPANADAWDALDPLVALVVDVVGVAESAEPGAWQAAPNEPTLPCYTVTFSEIVN